jgi:hypothetical protein
MCADFDFIHILSIPTLITPQDPVHEDPLVLHQHKNSHLHNEGFSTTTQDRSARVPHAKSYKSEQSCHVLTTVIARLSPDMRYFFSLASAARSTSQPIS